MYELVKINENDYYIDCPSKIGVVKISDTDVVFIDGGNGKDSAKKALRVIEAEGFTLKAIYCTHSHADHIGGCKLLQDRTGCKIYAKGIECYVTNKTVIEPSMLYGGYPYKDIMHRFLMAQSSICEELTEDNLPEGMQMLDLSGHSYDMTGFVTKNGTAYMGDCLSNKETLEKYGIFFLWNVEKFLETLEFVKTVQADNFVFSHVETLTDIKEIANYNIKVTNELSEKIVNYCKTPQTFENILKTLFDEYGLNLTAEQHVLISSVLRSYLSYNFEKEKIRYFFENNTMYWEKV